MASQDGSISIAHVRSTSDGAPYRIELTAGRHSLVADEPAVLGGGDQGPVPYQLLLCGLAACTSATLRMYAERKGWPLSGVRLDLRFQKGAEAAGDRIDRLVRLDGELSGDQRARLAEIAERTPVTLTLKAGVAIVTELR